MFPSLKKFFFYGVFFVSFITAFFVGGGLLVLANDDGLRLGQYIGTRATITLLCLLVSVSLGKRLAKTYGKYFYFVSLFLLLLFSSSLYAAEFTARFFAPPWPAIGLHGVTGEKGMHGWGRVEEQDGGIGFNSWSERDKERSRKPARGVTRIACIGDSLLEESTTIPLPLEMERKLADPNIEVINLGVSCSGPDEYYYRMKNIALPIGTKYLCEFFYSGNDFGVENPTLESIGGIVAVYPRDSLFSYLGLRALNHLITNHERPVLRAWGTAGDLHRTENSLWEMLKTCDDQTFKIILSTFVGQQHRLKVLVMIAKRKFTSLREIISMPDHNLFRSYYLQDTLQAMAGEKDLSKQVDESHAYRYIQKTYALCKKRGIGFTLVIIPEAFQVDPRMRSQWQELFEMGKLFGQQRAASERLRDKARHDGIDVVDLHELLDNQEGMYLNLDGHWSQKGVNAVAEYLSNHLSMRLNKAKHPNPKN